MQMGIDKKRLRRSSCVEVQCLLVFVQHTGSLAAWFTSCTNYRLLGRLVEQYTSDKLRIVVHANTGLSTARNEYPGNDDSGERLGRVYSKPLQHVTITKLRPLNIPAEISRM